jgi:hypothetical protein
VQSHLAGMLESVTPLTLNESQANMSRPYWNDNPIISTSGFVYVQEPTYQAMAVHVELIGANNMTEGDFLRNYSPTNCPMQSTWSQEGQKTDLFNEVKSYSKISDAIKAFSSAFNYTDDVPIDKITEYYDNYECNIYNNR